MHGVRFILCRRGDADPAPPSTREPLALHPCIKPKATSSWTVGCFETRKTSRGGRYSRQIGSKLQPCFGAYFANLTDTCGVIFGAIGGNGTILEDFRTWNLSRRDDGSLQVELTDLTKHMPHASPRLSQYVSRFGATVTMIPRGLALAGGIIPRKLVPGEKEILLLDSSWNLRG